MTFVAIACIGLVAAIIVALMWCAWRAFTWLDYIMSSEMGDLAPELARRRRPFRTGRFFRRRRWRR